MCAVFFLGHRGKRSWTARERRYARRLALDSSYRDRELAETISLINYENNAVKIEKGEVLTDTRGRGSTQQITG